MNTSPKYSSAPAALPIRTRPFGWLTELLLPVFEQDPARMRVWLSACRHEWHFVGLVIALVDDDELFPEIEPFFFAEKKKDIWGAVHPELDPRLVKLTGKLRGDLWQPQSSRRLLELMNDPAAARLLLKARSINRRKVMALARVPGPLRCSAVYERLKTAGDAERLTFAINLVERIRPDLSREEVLRNLAQTSGQVSLEGWARQHFRAVSFPAPLWAGTDVLKPLDSWVAVQKTALEFKNCIRGYVRDVLSGSCYLYLYDDGAGIKAVVEFIRLADDLWAIGEINGPDNNMLSSVGEAKVVQEAAGVALKLPGDDGAWAWADPSH
ncbi:MAG: hypothetical protein HRU11_03390 [Parvularculaceae bacterium]|nr:hypothetical protein [Parvularculaceae bacterium]